MGLFNNNKKDKKNTKYVDYQYSKNNKTAPTITAFDNMHYFLVRDCSDESLLEIADVILSGRAVLANFSKIAPSDANQMLSFLSGVVYASEGEYFHLESKLFLFAKKEELLDGSIYKYVEDSQ